MLKYYYILYENCNNIFEYFVNKFITLLFSYKTNSLIENLANPKISVMLFIGKVQKYSQGKN